jgi:hypothetical protein
MFAPFAFPGRATPALVVLVAVSALMLVTSGPLAVPANVLGSSSTSAPDRTHAA